MSKAFAYILNTNSQAFTAAGGTVNPGTSVHGYGRNCCGYIIQVNGNNINLAETGYYEMIPGATVSASAAGNVTLGVYQDGALVAQNSAAIAAANDPATISFPVGLKVNCNSVITIMVSASAGTPIVTNIGTTIKKIKN